MAAGAVDFLRGLFGWWSGDGAAGPTPPDTVDIVYTVGTKRPYYTASTNRPYYTTTTKRPFWKANT